MPFEQSIIINGKIYLELFEGKWRETSKKDPLLGCVTRLFPPGAEEDITDLSIERWATSGDQPLKIELRRNEGYDIWLSARPSDLSYRLSQTGGPLVNLHPGELLLIPPGLDTGTVVDLRAIDSFRISVSPPLMARAAEAIPGRSEMEDLRISAQKTGDEILKHLIFALIAEVSSADSATAAHANNIGFTLAVHLVATFGATKGKETNVSMTMPLPSWRLKRVLNYIEDHLGDELDLEVLSKVAGLSRMYFGAQFREATGTSPHRYVLNRRVAASLALLRDTERSIEEVARRSGFKSDTHFIKVFRKIVGISPGNWRKDAKGK